MEEAAELGRAIRERLLRERKPVVVVLQGDDVGVRFRIVGSSVIGRDPECEIVLRNVGVSWRHAKLEVRDGDVWVVDMGSTNGTLLEGQKVSESKVAAGDKLFLGTTVLRIDWQDALEEEFHEELERLLSIDELTGLLSRRRFDAEGSALVQATLASGKAVSVLMMDLDGVKKINDAHGHAFGAHVIAESGALIGRTLGARGIATRWGGDEYAAILPGIGYDDARAVAEEVLAAVRAHPYERDGIVLHPGISIGLASGPDQGGDLETLMRWADDALYRAKRGGRNRVSG